MTDWNLKSKASGGETMHASIFFGLISILMPAVLFAVPSEIKVDLMLDASDYVIGERIRAVVNVVNSSPDRISVGYPQSPDHLFIEVFRASDKSRLSKVSSGAYVARFDVRTGEGQRLETFIGDHYDLRTPSRYLAQPVLVHGGIRYEGMPRAFDIVSGVRICGALQMFAKHPGLQREFFLVYWARNRTEHLFLTAVDTGSSRPWETRDLGPILRIDKPTISILATGEVIVLHRLNADQFVRSEFWSLPKQLEFRLRETVSDPETAATRRVRDLYKEKGVQPKTNPWWKFW